MLFFMVCVHDVGCVDAFVYGLRLLREKKIILKIKGNLMFIYVYFFSSSIYAFVLCYCFIICSNIFVFPVDAFCIMLGVFIL